MWVWGVCGEQSHRSNSIGAIRTVQGEPAFPFPTLIVVVVVTATIMPGSMARIHHILLLVCVLPGAALPSFIAAKLISPAAVSDAPDRAQSVNTDPAATAEAVRFGQADTGQTHSESRHSHDQDEDQNTANGFSALRPSPPEVPKENHRDFETSRFGETAKAIQIRWSAGRTLMAARLGRVVAASECDATEMASVAPSILPHGPPAGC